MENNLFTVEVLNVNELESVKGGKTVITKTETRPDGTVVTTRIELDQQNQNKTVLRKSVCNFIILSTNEEFIDFLFSINSSKVSE